MAKIGGFDPYAGITQLRDGAAEIGKANLPGSVQVLPESMPGRSESPIYGRLTDSTLMEGFAAYLKLDLKHRELLSPDVFFESLESALREFESGAGSGGGQGEGPMVEAARALAEILADRNLCEMLRNLVMKA